MKFVHLKGISKKIHKQRSRGVFRKRCSENMQQIYRRTPMPKCDFNKVAKHGCSPVNLLHIFRAPFAKSTSGRLLLKTPVPESLFNKVAGLRPKFYCEFCQSSKDTFLQNTLKRLLLSLCCMLSILNFSL